VRNHSYESTVLLSPSSQGIFNNFLVASIFLGSSEELLRILSPTLTQLQMEAAPMPSLTLLFDVDVILERVASMIEDTVSAVVQMVVEVVDRRYA